MQQEDIEIILEEYGCTLTKTHDSFGEGVSSLVVALETKEFGAVILKESNWYTFLAPEEAHRALESVCVVSELLRSAGVFVPQMLPTAGGSYVAVHNGKTYLLQKKVEGLTFDHSYEHIHTLGKTLGAFHRLGRSVLANHPDIEERITATIPVEKPYEESRDIYAPALKQKLLSVHECTLTDVCEVVQTDLTFIEACMNRVDTAQIHSTAFTKSILHNDLNTRNILLSRKGAGTVIDVDQIGYGSCVMDIANTLNSFTWKFVEEDQTLLPWATEAFLRGYQSEHQLQAHEYEALVPAGLRWDLMRILRSLRRHHFENNRFPELTQNIKKRFLPRLHSTAQNFSFITHDWITENIIS